MVERKGTLKGSCRHHVATGYIKVKRKLKDRPPFIPLFHYVRSSLRYTSLSSMYKRGTILQLSLNFNMVSTSLSHFICSCGVTKRIPSIPS
jgi:hypothetical protein